MKMGAGLAVVKYVYAVISDKSDSSILMIRCGDRWTLPNKKYDRFCVEDHEFCKDIQEQISPFCRTTPVCTLRYKAYVGEDTDNQTKHVWEANVLETHSAIEISDEMAFVTRREFDQLKTSSTFAAMRDIIISFLTPQKRETRVYRVPWAERGWFQEISEWAAKQLDASGHGMVINIVQIWNRLSAHVIRFDTDTASFFVKASHPAVEEAAFTQWLSKMFPVSVPKVLQVDESRNVFIMEDFSTTHQERKVQNAEEMRALYQYFGKMQLQSVELMHVPQNIIGIPKSRFLRPKDLVSEIENLLNDSELHEYLEDGEIQTLRSHSSTWVEMCNHLADSGIPCSIVHRDLFMTNFARSKQAGNEFLIFDWFFGCVSHPFIHLGQMRRFKGTSEKSVESYLSLWRRYEPDMDKLRTIERLAGMVQPLVDAVDFLRMGRKSEAAEQGVIATPLNDERKSFFKAVALRLRLMARFAEFYEQADKERCPKSRESDKSDCISNCNFKTDLRASIPFGY